MAWASQKFQVDRTPDAYFITGKLPLGLGTVATALIGAGGKKLLLGSEEEKPSKKSTNNKRGSDRSRRSEKSKSSNDGRSSTTSRPSHKALGIMPPEDRRFHKKSDSGSQTDKHHKRKSTARSRR